MDELAAQARTGSQDACTALYQRLGPMALSIVRRMLSFAPLWVQDDTAHDGKVQVLMMLHRWDSKRPFDTWAYSVIRHVAFACLRRMDTQSRKAVEVPIELGKVVVKAVGPSAEALVIEKEEREALYASMQHRSQSTLRLYEYGFNTAEVGELLGIIPRSAHKNLYYISVNVGRWTQQKIIQE